MEIVPNCLEPPLFRNPHLYPAVTSGSAIVFESSTGCIERPPDVANTLAKSALRYISRHLDTRLEQVRAVQGSFIPSGSLT